jgi:hypothetical protein
VPARLHKQPTSRSLATQASQCRNATTCAFVWSATPWRGIDHHWPVNTSSVGTHKAEAPALSAHLVPPPNHVSTSEGRLYLRTLSAGRLSPPYHSQAEHWRDAQSTTLPLGSHTRRWRPREAIARKRLGHYHRSMGRQSVSNPVTSRWALLLLLNKDQLENHRQHLHLLRP